MTFRPARWLRALIVFARRSINVQVPFGHKINQVLERRTRLGQPMTGPFALVTAPTLTRGCWESPYVVSNFKRLEYRLWNGV